MQYTDLRHGDVLLYERSKRINLYSRVIRLIIGSKVVHVSILQELNGELYVLEQSLSRSCLHVSFYEALDGEVISCARPKFKAPPTNLKLFKRGRYSYISIFDSLLNHTLNQIYPKWIFKPLLVRLFKVTKFMCSALVAKALKLDEKFDWAIYPSVVEPDDFVNRIDLFEQLGVVEWNPILTQEVL